MFIARAGVKAPGVRALAMQDWKPEFRSQNLFQRFLLFVVFFQSRVMCPYTYNLSGAGDRDRRLVAVSAGLVRG